MYWILITILILTLIYFFTYKSLSYWRGKNVPQKSILHVLNSMFDSLKQRKSFAELIAEFYNEFPEERYSGAYVFGSRPLILRDLELIKKVTVKDFDHFMDHKSLFSSDDSEPLWANNLFSLGGEKWRHMRATLSPSFTSSKMKMMFVLMSQCAEDFVSYFVNNPQISDEIDLTDVVTRFTNDVIATTAFGVKCDSLKDRTNEFYLMGKDATGIFKGTWAALKFTLFMMAPKIAKFLGLRVFSKKVAHFFLDLVTRTIKLREEKHVVRPDLINLLMEARRGKNKDDSSNVNEIDVGFATVQEYVRSSDYKKNAELSDIDITAQALVFFFGGFDTVSRTMCFIAHEVAVNPDVQARLQQEIDDTLNECDGKVTYEALTKMKYMDMVVTEGLRLWPNGLMLDRLCVKPYTIEAESSHEKTVYINKGDIVWVPVFGIHRDPQYYPDPLRFDPERFNDENKKNIKPYTYIPFGSGPRNCIGSRFALLETKILLFHLLSKFKFVPTSKTEIPLRLSTKDFNLQAKNGFYLSFKPRNAN